ncbi:hypothetical protein AMTR_s00052p00211340 [Amborella trichopoda]|uniref:Uncharacterized protein n=1 Tax=Amborella trichopoda TaxID=13333 RepID=U5D2I9_AMBTC|nr:hypothetical protein AMTR_s00052p00211340 [Amborella trichopoda]
MVPPNPTPNPNPMLISSHGNSNLFLLLSIRLAEGGGSGLPLEPWVGESRHKYGFPEYMDGLNVSIWFPVGIGPDKLLLDRLRTLKEVKDEMLRGMTHVS